MCNLHGGMNASSQLQPCNFQKRRSHLRSKHSILVSLYDCSCALMYFSTPLSFVQRNRTYCSVVRHLVVRSKTVPSPCYSLEVENKKKILKTRRVFLPLLSYTLSSIRDAQREWSVLTVWRQAVVMAAAPKASCFSVFTFRQGRFTDLNREGQTKRLVNFCCSLECAGTPSRQKTSECSTASAVWCWTGTWW